MQSINGGNSNIQPTPNTIKEGPLHKKELLPEIHEKIMSYLNNEDTSTLSSITSSLNEKTIHVVKNQEFLKVASFGRSLADKLPEKYKDQKEALSHLVTSDEYKANLTFDEMKEKLNNVKAEIKQILLTLPQEDLANLFDAFKGPKPKLYFDFVPLSNKHKQLYIELSMITMFKDDNTFRETLEKGAYATEKSFETAIKKDEIGKMIILSEFGYKPTTNNLNYAIQNKYERVNTQMLDKTVTKKVIELIKNQANDTIITLLELGAKPTAETLEIAKKVGVDMTIFDNYKT